MHGSKQADVAQRQKVRTLSDPQERGEDTANQACHEASEPTSNNTSSDKAIPQSFLNSSTHWGQAFSEHEPVGTIPSHPPYTSSLAITQRNEEEFCLKRFYN